MLIILTNIPTPYRTNFFNVLNKQLSVAKTGFHVLYCAETEPNRSWKFYPEQNTYPYTFLKGIHLSVGDFCPHFNPGVISSLKKLKPSVVIVAGSWNTPTMILATFFLKFTSSKVIFWSEGHADRVVIKKGIVAFLRKRMYSMFDAFAVPNTKSEEFVTDYLGIKNKKFLSLPNTVEDAFFFKRQPIANEMELREKLGLSNSKKIAIQVSHLVDTKGVVELVKGWLGLAPSYSDNWVLLLVGSGNKLDEISELIKTANGNDKIKLLGQIKPEEVRDILHIANLFILATKLDSNPLSVIEAAFSGLPLIVSSKAGNVGEILKNNFNGYILDNVDPSSITNILTKALTLEFSELKLMGKHSQEIAENYFKTNEVVNNFVRSLQSLLHIIPE